MRDDLTEQERAALDNALASTRMEGFQITEQMEEDCIRLIKGKVTADKLLSEILARNTESS